MGRRLEAITPSERNGQTFWTKIGSAFENENGWTLVLDALPVNGKVLLRPPSEPGSYRQNQSADYGAQQGGNRDKLRHDPEDKPPF